MDDTLFDWDDPGDPGGNTAHITEHGLAPDEVESVLLGSAGSQDSSGSTGRPIVFGTTYTGRFIAVVFEIMNDDDPFVVRPITAYEVPEPA